MPFAPPLADSPDYASIGSQSLRAAVTRQATIFRHYPQLPAPAPPAPANPAATRSAAFDNFFYGGTRAAGAVAAFGPAPPPGAPDSGNAIDLIAYIVRPGSVVAANQIEVSGAATFYGSTHAADRAPSLQAAGFTALRLTQRWIGANLVSDHVPVTLDIP